MDENGFRNITFQQLEALIGLVEAGSFTRAAERMGLAQPTLTKQIHALEEAAGARVVFRRHAGIALTPEGRILHDVARRIARLREEAREKITHARSDESGDIVLCASTIPATYILPRLLSRLKKSDPQIRVHILTGDSEEAVQTILAGQAEIGIIGKPPPDRKLVVEPLWPDRLVLAVPAGHPWAKRPSIAPGQLTEQPFILRERGSGTRAALEAWLGERSICAWGAFEIVCEMGSSEAVKEAVMIGLGVSVLSIHAIQREVDHGLLAALPLEGCPIDRRFHLIHKKQFQPTRHHRRFINAVKQFQL
jgi:DNA-binding transcriptional LysR family regulator